MNELMIQKMNELSSAIQSYQQAAPCQPPALEGSKILFTDFMEEWLAGKKMQLCTNTMDKYKSLYENHVKSRFMGMVLSEITIKALQDLINDKTNQLSPATIRAIVSSILRPALHEAVGRDLIRKNPAEFVKTPKLEEEHGRALTDLEIEWLLMAAKGHRLFIVLPLMLMTGLRRGETLALTWEDIDFENREIIVTKNYVSTSSNRCECKAPKTKSSIRRLSIPDYLVNMLKEYKETQGGNTYVVSQRKCDKMIDPTNFGRLFKGWCKKAGIKASPHDLRHTYCSVSLEVGIPSKTIADQVGHADTRMLERIYAHNRTNELQQNAADKIGEKFGNVFKITA